MGRKFLVAFTLFAYTSLCVAEDITDMVDRDGDDAPDTAAGDGSPHAPQLIEIKGNELPPQLAKQEAHDYQIGPHDLIEIEVFQAPELSRKVRVNSLGNISLPLIGAVKAAGLTLPELESYIMLRLGEEYLQDPQVSVFIVEYTSQRVTVEGYVRKPGIYPIQGKTTLLQALAMAQGLVEDLADTDAVTVFRADQAGKMLAYQLDIDKIRQGEMQDPLIKGDDRIVVQKSGSKAFLKGITGTLRGFVGFGNPLQ